MTAEEVLKPYIETPFRHTKVVSMENALMAMNIFAASVLNNAKTSEPDAGVKMDSREIRVENLMIKVKLLDSGAVIECGGKTRASLNNDAALSDIKNFLSQFIRDMKRCKVDNFTLIAEGAFYPDENPNWEPKPLAASRYPRPITDEEDEDE